MICEDQRNISGECNKPLQTLCTVEIFQISEPRLAYYERYNYGNRGNSISVREQGIFGVCTVKSIHGLWHDISRTERSFSDVYNSGKDGSWLKQHSDVVG